MFAFVRGWSGPLFLSFLFFFFFFCFQWGKLLDNNNTVDSTVGKYQLKLLR
jgi:hypothetical protein